jgi:NTP pyrophosphatase (non-canonical NTP hydrolase)
VKAGNFSIGGPIWSGLSKLIEECGEVQQLAGKLIATGGVVEHWDGSNLRERLIEELADLAAAVTYFSQANGLDTEEFHARRRAKIEQFLKWEAEQR